MSKSRRPFLRCQCGSILTWVTIQGNHWDVYCAVCGDFVADADLPKNELIEALKGKKI